LLASVDFLTQSATNSLLSSWFESCLVCSAGLERREHGRRDPSLRPLGTLHPQKLAPTSPTSGGRSVGPARSRTQATESLCVPSSSSKSLLVFSSFWPLKKLHGLSLRANYTDRATVACRRSDCQLLRIKRCHVVTVTDPYGRILGFLDRSRYFSIK
jgi:hypothetical protein